jgi:hypothetical protein
MKPSIIIPTLILLTGCAGMGASLGVGVSKNPSIDLQGDNPIGYARLFYETNGFRFEYQHQSSIPDGPPINDRRDERWQESFSVHKEWRFK